jgi:hypothetical protein
MGYQPLPREPKPTAEEIRASLVANWQRLYVGPAPPAAVLPPAPPGPHRSPEGVTVTHTYLHDGKNWVELDPRPPSPVPGCLMVLFVSFAIYFIVAMTVFGLRHPWLTDVERLFHMGRALVFGSVDPPAEKERDDDR